MKQTKDKTIITIALLVLVAVSMLAGCQNDVPVINDPNLKVDDKIKRFESAEQLKEAFEKAQGSRGNMYYGAMEKGRVMETAVQASAAPTAASGASDSAAGQEFSATNIQVEGVDEADIIKTDGEYICAIANGKLYIAKAYPAQEAKVLSTIKLEGFSPMEIFIHEDRLLVFGYEESVVTTEQTAKCAGDKGGCLYPSYRQMVSVKLFDTADKQKPELLRTVDFEGEYLTSRKIGEDAYVVINSWPRYNVQEPIDIIPLYKEDNESLKPVAQPTEIGYIEPLYAQNFITVAAISMADENKEISKEVIAGSGQNVYASLENLYIAQTTYPTYDAGELVKDNTIKTVITKFALDDGKITFVGNGAVKGNILNQFSMDEFKGNFRIATTISGYVDNRDTSTNNMYVLNKDLETIGKVEEIAPGESIYSVRFMGNRAYMVTFKHVDPLFVIDLAEPSDPKILGKLKIPGYSEYLHPYDETHLIGLGKEVDESIDADKVHTEGAVYYTAIQGVKLAIFDVSDVSNPIELHKEIIGDRGTQSLAADEHKAFLFDKEKGLLVIPITVAELQEGQDKSQEGEFTFQGAYVYDVSLDDGFKLRGRVTHDTDNHAMLKSGYYYDYSTQIKRSLYIDNTLYTMSDKMLKMNDLDRLAELSSLRWE